MKKVILLLSVVVSALSANAQLNLTGASPYTQNFDGLTDALPDGWSGYIKSSPTYLGEVYAFENSLNFGVYDTTNGYNAAGSPCVQNVNKAGFKNYPSADVCSAGDSCTVQQLYTNRAFGVRQASPTASTGPGFDSGAAFVLNLNSTHGMTGVTMGFKLQSLDTTSGRTTHWKVQYGIGAAPTTFADATVTGTMTTGGHIFANHDITANFGTALDNLSSPVFIRIVTLDFTSGSGNRASTAIDDVTLNWIGTAATAVTDVHGANAVGLTVLGDATSNNVNLAYSTEIYGNYDLKLYDLSGRTILTQAVTAQAGSQTINLAGLNLMPGMYFAKLSNANGAATAKIAIK